MAYIGSAVSKQSDIKRITFATSTTGSGPFALGWAPDSEASLRVTINGVTQQGSDITISGSNLTIAETLVSGDELEVVGIVHTGDSKPSANQRRNWRGCNVVCPSPDKILDEDRC